MSRIMWIVYTQPLYRIVVFILLLIIVWSAAGVLADKKRWWKPLNAIVCIAITAIILYATVYSREESSRQVILTPFITFEYAKIQPELYRTMLMNMFLFVPLGLSLPFVLPFKHGAVFTVIVAIALSAAVEAVQYHLGLGLSEIDDVITNTLGAAIGTLPFVIGGKIKRGAKAS